MHVLWFIGSLLMVFVGACILWTLTPVLSAGPWQATVAAFGGAVLFDGGIVSAFVAIVHDLCG